MTPTEARNVAIAIADTWPNGHINIERWVEPIGRLEIDDARTTYRWLRDHTETAPTIAGFIAKNRELGNHHAAGPLRTPCMICDGTGWESITVHRPGHPHPTSGVKPCRCSNGQAVTPGYHRALDDNDRTLGRTPLKAIS